MGGTRYTSTGRWLLLVLLWRGTLTRGETVTGQIRVTTEPPGAAVFCDGVPQESAPVVLRGLTPGAHLVAVRKPGYYEARRTVQLEAGKKLEVDFKLEAVTGLVLVQASPRDSEVEIDGAYRGRTPLLLTDLPVGKYRLRLTAPGYLPREVELTVAEDRIPQLLKVDLPSDSAKLVVTSVPEGATVTVNGIVRGTTPCEVDRLPEGENKLVITLSEYLPSQMAVTLRAGDVHEVNVELKPLPGTLSVASTPPAAKVYVDEELKGQAPLVLDTLPPGTHTVRVELDGYAPETRTVEIAKGVTTKEEFRLTRNSGLLEIVTEPPGVRVVVDGEEQGLTATGITEIISQPFRVDPLAVGEHRVVLSKKGYYPVERTVNIELGQRVPLRVSLRRRFTPDTRVRTTGKGEPVVGCVSRRFPNGDIEIETKPGIFVTIKALEIIAVEPLSEQEGEERSTPVP